MSGDTEIGDAMRKHPRVTWHAVRRYEDRVEAVRTAIVVRRLTGPAFDAVNDLGGGAVILPSGHRAVCGEGAVITVLEKGRRFLGFRGKNWHDE